MGGSPLDAATLPPVAAVAVDVDVAGVDKDGDGIPDALKEDWSEWLERYEMRNVGPPPSYAPPPPPSAPCLDTRDRLPADSKLQEQTADESEMKAAPSPETAATPPAPENAKTTAAALRWRVKEGSPP